MSTQHYLEQLNLTEMMEELDNLFPAVNLDFSLLFEKIVEGGWQEAGKLIWQWTFGTLQMQIGGMKSLMVSILVLGMLSVLVSGFITGFENHQIVQIAHYIFYLLMLSVLITIFGECYEAAQEVLSGMAEFSKLLLPALCLSVGTAAGSVTAAGYYELAMLLIFLVENFLLKLCLPMMPAFMLLLLMNGVWEEGKLAALMELLEKFLLFTAKFCVAAVTGLGVLQSMVAPALDSLKRNALQKAVSAIPGLGGIAEGSAQMVIGSAVLIKNSLGVFALLLLAVLVAVPLMKLLLYGGLLRLSGSLIGIVAQKQLTACVLRTADAVFLMLRLSGSGAVCFMILIAIVTCLVGG
ncbi:MAG: stage III sporulation protein AE [Lachnospiraceae bacterium]|nr:stage III sporulation protein AE [Lachnospiraceae bacterium]